MKLFRLFFLYFCFLAQSLYAQFEGFTPKLPVQSTETYKNSNIYQQDFLYLCEGLSKFHANAYLNFPEEEFNRQKEIIFNQLAACSSADEFATLANKFTNRVRDGHTGIKTKGRVGSSRIYPFRCKYLSDTLIIMAVSDQLPLTLWGEKIESLNGVSITDIEKKYSEVYSAENYVALQNRIMQEINSTEFLMQTNVIHSDSEIVNVKTFSGKEFEASPDFNGNWKSPFSAQTSTKTPYKPYITEQQSDAFLYKIDTANRICYIQFNKMIDKRIGEMYIEMLPLWKRWLAKTIMFFGVNTGIPKTYFEDFLNTCTEDIAKNNIKKVVVDLRWNTGGSGLLGDLLLYALGIDKYKGFTSETNESELYKTQMAALGLDKSNFYEKDSTDGFALTKSAKATEAIKKRFNGDAYFITSEWTFSSAVQLAAIVKDNGLFKVVGEPVSERPSHFGEVLFLKLPNTNQVCSMSCKLFHRPDKSKDSEDTLYPDVTIYKTYDDITGGIDRVYEWIISQPVKNL